MADEAKPTYWYAPDPESAPGRRVLEAMRSYRAAETAMRRRTRQEMSLGENDMRVIRFVMRGALENRRVTPTDIARHVGISTASTTLLIDRLVTSRHLVRSPGPDDGRRVLITHTPHADDEVRAVFGEMHQQMLESVRGLTDAEAETVASFLKRMQQVVDGTMTAGMPRRDA